MKLNLKMVLSLQLQKYLKCCHHYVCLYNLNNKIYKQNYPRSKAKVFKLTRVFKLDKTEKSKKLCKELFLITIKNKKYFLK